MFRALGHANVKVLDGGLPAWLPLEQDVVSAPSNGPRGDFIARFRPGLVKSKAGVLGALGTCQILDARAKGRFDGTAPEPRKGLSSGHMPGAISTPFGNLKTDDGFLKSKAELADIFGAAGFGADSPAITSCGSGVTACGIALALARFGVWDAAVYDGSWVEWASDPASPIDTINSESAP